MIVPLAFPGQSAMAFTAPRGEVELRLMAERRVEIDGGMIALLLLLLSCSCCAAAGEQEKARAKSSSTAAARAAKRRRCMAWRKGKSRRGK